ncbi:glycosyltransferase family 2 protein [Candidatus Woesearchaeota archaeon]|nr:glycosyltransferase family 2 protein [Candidatus Woesearchaeota archaeon]
MPIYEDADWADYAIKAHLEHVDHLIIGEGYHGPIWHFWTNRSKDGTRNIIKRYKDHPKVTLMRNVAGPRVEIGKGLSFKKILSKFKRMGIREGDWIMLCDVDEFYTEEQMKKIRRIMRTTKKDMIRLKARIFVYDFTHYIDGYSKRLWRYTKGMKFHFYNQYALYANGSRYQKSEHIALEKDPMFHYSFIRTNEREYLTRLMEVKGGSRSKESLDWYDHIYYKWNEKNADKLYKENERNTGVYGWWPGSERVIKKYRGRHPKILDNHPYRHVPDMRNIKTKIVTTP